MSEFALSLLTSPLERAIETFALPYEITGTISPTLLAWLLSQTPAESWQSRPRLVVVPHEKIMDQMVEALRALNPAIQTICLPAFDELPYSGLYPSSHTLHARSHFLWAAHGFEPAQAARTVFIATIEGLLQKTVPLKSFFNYALRLNKGDEIDMDLLGRQLAECGYQPAPLVEDSGTFAKRGGLIDIFSPAHDLPVRIELFGDQIESIRLFDPESQRTEKLLDSAVIIPPREIFLTSETLSLAGERLAAYAEKHEVPRAQREEVLGQLRQKIFFQGIDYLLPFFYDKLDHPIDTFHKTPLVFWLDEIDIVRSADRLFEVSRQEYKKILDSKLFTISPDELYQPFNEFRSHLKSYSVNLNAIHITDVQEASVGESEEESKNRSAIKAFDTTDLSSQTQADREAQKDFFVSAAAFFKKWKEQGLAVFIFVGSQTQAQRIQYLCESNGLSTVVSEPEESRWGRWIAEQQENGALVRVVPRPLAAGLRIPEDHVVLLRDEDIFGTRQHKRSTQKSKGTLEQRANTLSFRDLSPNDLVVHEQHGVAVYEGLKIMNLQGVENEFIQLKFKDNDKLYLPIYRIGQLQKYSSPAGSAPLDKLGGTSWQKAKVKVRSALRDVANELLVLYAKRQSAMGFAFSAPDVTFREFEATFPYDETPDQEKAITDVISDMEKPRPMDRLVCGDVGFGKTEVAIRAAFKAVQDQKQVAILVPTTVLAFQHYQTFSKRFKDWPVRVAVLSRFTPTAQVKKDLADLAQGKVDIIIGTHKLLGKDVIFKDLGLLIIDEEQKFGVTHKEKIKRMRTQIDVLALSATPIPRTLNMSLMGIRDLSIINTPPEERLSIRTFVTRFNEETIHKAIMSEIQRGGQTFFIHNRVQSIYGLQDELRRIVPEARIRVGHGQMQEADLEKTMLDFYEHEYDVLLSTTIIESGLDIPRVNTIIIERADTFGLSQLYQLRGRVGRSKERAYAYLLLPERGNIDPTAAERLKILQEYTELGSGFHIAHHDLELRGSGNILGEDQSGHISAVGYELYMELLEQALSEAKGEPIKDEVEPEINLRIPALIPDEYIEDIRIRLSYYKALSEIESEQDIERIEAELNDRFGPVPAPVTNLFGIMMIRKICRDLGVRDISAGPKNVSVAFTPSTKASPNRLIELAIKQNSKYQITPDSRLIIRLHSGNWAAVLEELKFIKNYLF